ncbi:MAG: CHAT domain-containing protein [Candidatus Magnetobacterium sp. LHC-1]|uniref:CHAT domain-containing protein n=1 Tax=Candidatus Magnetobacterium casense TaxID=1455061 RepID=A0ABS6RYH9_9BACT|nr:CHAT domain-containing protein [Candidatus Magnetobacterium casensis]MBF0609148.1 CHAT domain-containing protein [Nitrospirota bacterium]MBV6341697.1 CHAT domain-containing protein [Candidatus Magnetobacterium casensis]
MSSISIKISDTANDRREVHINGELSYHINEDELTGIVRETHKSLWEEDGANGAEIGKSLYKLLNRSAGKLQEIIRAARDTNTHATLYLQTPYELTQLPFELLNDGSFVLLDHNIHIIRLVDERGSLASVTSKKGPINMLFMACSPKDKKRLDFENEEELIFNETANYNISMTVEYTGSLKGLKKANIAAGGFDVIHITGHAGIDDAMSPVFCMEDEAGNCDQVSPQMLWDAIRYFPPKILFLSACLTGDTDNKMAYGSFAYLMTKKGINWVLAWGVSVKDEASALVITEVYRSLAIGQRIDHAVQNALRLPEIKHHSWPLLRLFGNAAPIVPLVQAGLPPKANNPVYVRRTILRDGGINVLASGFVGKRPYLKDGSEVLARGKDGKFGLLIHGPADTGKSCLAAKLIERRVDKELVAFKGVINEEGVVSKLRRLLNRLGNLNILSSNESYEDKIRDLFRNVFNSQVAAIIYFDGFEENLEPSGGKYYVKPETIAVIRPFLEAVEWAEGNSNVVITSRNEFVLEHYGENLPATKLFGIGLQ